MKSLPSRGRGLKFGFFSDKAGHLIVAPFTGAWIEIWQQSERLANESSLPSRGRGLKLS